MKETRTDVNISEETKILAMRFESQFNAHMCGCFWTFFWQFL